MSDLPPIPTGFSRVSGKRSPPRGETRYFIQLRQGHVDMVNTYTAAQLRWIWDGGPGDVVAVMDAD